MSKIADGFRGAVPEHANKLARPTIENPPEHLAGVTREHSVWNSEPTLIPTYLP